MSLIGLLQLLVFAYQLILLARVVISFVQVDPYHPVVQFLFRVTEPVLEPIRQFLPQSGGLDFSPLVVMVLLQLVLVLLT